MSATTEPISGLKATTSDSLIRVDDVVRYYPNGNVTAVNHVSLTINRGEYVAIMGPSGCGKSSLLNLIGSLDLPTSGTIYFENQSLANHPSLDSFRATKIGFVFQAFHLLPTLTSLENVQVPMFTQSLTVAQRVARAKELLDLVGMSHRMDALPDRLSIGEKQRVAIARALANKPEVLLADEPTGNLDSVNGQAVLELFDRLHRVNQMTLVIITHSPEVAQCAERVIHLRDGRISHETRREEAEAVVTGSA
jgi:putative ABC transport system ATP-binding protein